MNAKENQTLSQIFTDWDAEDGELQACVDVVRGWMQEVNQLGIPHFGETATRLQPLYERLVHHFEREDVMIAQLAKSYPTSSPEVDAVRSQSAYDHNLLLARLDDLMQRLNQLEPPFTSWQAAIDEIELFVDALEQHEEQESESIRTLMPGEST